ncbi:hypothetical protein ABZP36_006585, partial [Zizania latifolia]
VVELGPALYVVELRKSHGDPALYRQICVRISSDLGVCKPEQIFRTELLDDDLQDSSVGTPLVIL